MQNKSYFKKGRQIYLLQQNFVRRSEAELLCGSFELQKSQQKARNKTLSGGAKHYAALSNYRKSRHPPCKNARSRFVITGTRILQVDPNHIIL